MSTEPPERAESQRRDHGTDDDPNRVEARALVLLTATGEAIVARIERCVPDWAVVAVGRVLDAWSALDRSARERTLDAAAVAGRAGAVRLGVELRALMALDPDTQPATPLEIVRSAYREPTVVLREAGAPPVTRDAFCERALPDDVYDLSPRTFADLGDPALAPLHRAWGAAKATVFRSRQARATD